MRKVARAVIDIVGALSLIGMVLRGNHRQQTGYGRSSARRLSQLVEWWNHREETE